LEFALRQGTDDLRVQFRPVLGHGLNGDAHLERVLAFLKRVRARLTQGRLMKDIGPVMNRLAVLKDDETEAVEGGEEARLNREIVSRIVVQNDIAREDNGTNFLTFEFALEMNRLEFHAAHADQRQGYRRLRFRGWLLVDFTAFCRGSERARANRLSC